MRITLRQLKEDVPLPCILHWNQNHFVVCYKIKDDRYYIADPAAGKVVYREAEFTPCWYSTKVNGEETGTALLLEPGPEFYEQEEEPEEMEETEEPEESEQTETEDPAAGTDNTGTEDPAAGSDGTETTDPAANTDSAGTTDPAADAGSTGTTDPAAGTDNTGTGDPASGTQTQSTEQGTN